MTINVFNKVDKSTKQTPHSSVIDSLLFELYKRFKHDFGLWGVQDFNGDGLITFVSDKPEGIPDEIYFNVKEKFV